MFNELRYVGRLTCLTSLVRLVDVFNYLERSVDLFNVPRIGLPFHRADVGWLTFQGS